MKSPILYIFILVSVFAPWALADITTNSDFNPFPQMEQNLNNTDDQQAAAAEQQNDAWPPANAQTKINSEGGSD